MHSYICETEHAVRGLFDLVGLDDIALARHRDELQAVTERLQRARSLLRSGPPPTSFGEDTTPYYERQARQARADARSLETSVSSLRTVVDAKAVSVQALSGAILQIAKQGISIARGGLAGCPAGRSVGRDTLANTIWQARNQALHWEDGVFSTSVTACFANLAADFGPAFELSVAPAAPLARQVILVLGWDAYDAYEADMQSLLG